MHRKNRENGKDMISQETLDESGTSALDKRELDLASKVITSLNLARKNYSLYPEGHTILTNALETFSKLLESFLLDYNELEITITRDQLLSQGEVIHTEQAEAGALPFILFRDGVRKLTFFEGVDHEELLNFFRIITKHITLTEEPEGDIVTDFWEANFAHITYVVSEMFFASDHAEVVESVKDAQKETQSKLRELKLADWDPLPDPAIDRSVITISPSDIDEVKGMIMEEEDEPAAYLDALFDSLLQYPEQENYDIILEVMEEEYENSLSRQEFDVAVRILQNLERISMERASVEPWAGASIHDFILRASSARSLDALHQVWADIDPSQADLIREFLDLLLPVAIQSLGPLLAQKQHQVIRQVLMESLIILASKDIGPLQALVRNPGEKLMERLVFVCTALKGPAADEILTKLVRHSSPNVRLEALKALLQRGRARKEDFFGLIDDENPTVRHLALKHLSTARDRAAEGILLDYLEHRKPRKDDDSHIMSCYTALGRCGSDRSVPFLKQTLLGKAWVPGFTNQVQREGAAAALKELRTKTAMAVLEEASRSLNPGIRKLGQKYMP
jgi:hypothetical protein